jgi:hypothetical protein
MPRKMARTNEKDNLKKVLENNKSAIDSVERWKLFSLTPHTVDELIDACIYHQSSICYSYVCKVSKIPCDFIDTFSVLSTGKIGSYKDLKDKKYMDSLLNAIRIRRSVKDPVASVHKCIVERENGYKYEINAIDIKEKLDWYYISQYQDLSEDFILSHLDCLSLDMVYKYQNISQEFKMAHKEILNSRQILDYLSDNI